MQGVDGGELLVRALRAEGIDVLVSIPDIGQSPMLRSAERAGMRLVHPRHESAGVHLAEGYARVSGGLAAVGASGGPGVANLLPGLACAWMEGWPVVAIGTQRVRRTLHAVRRGRFQYGPLLEAATPLTKYAARVEEPARIPEIVREAVRHATAARPGPVYIEIPTDVMGATVVDPVDTSTEGRRARPGAPDPAAVAAAAALLADATFPLILAGQGASAAGASEELRALAEHTGALVMTTAGARGVFPEDHPQSVGMTFPWGTPAHLDADVILAVGTQLGEATQYLGPPAWAGPPAQRVIHLDADASVIGVNRAVDMALVADARDGLAALAAACSARGPARRPSDVASAYARDAQAFRVAVADSYLAPDAPAVHPGHLAVTVARHFGDDAIACFDGGNTTLWAHLAHVARRPRSLLWTSHFGHLGTGLPYAMGAKVAAPDRPVYLITGDGAFGFNMQELETMAREGIAVVAVVACDFAWGMEVVHMQKAAGTNAGVRHSHVRYDEVARALGCFGARVQRPGELVRALDAAIASGGPAVVQVEVDPGENEQPPGLDDFVAMYAATST
ncbi:MAG: thiamine pyrophosphate-binding protein [Acidimicrobiia bacterium]|jgi:acetolactate synthase-1/2/3 large subunit